jgi:hypothetical protein
MKPVVNFNKAINEARITIKCAFPHPQHDLYIDTVSDMDGQFFMASDTHYNSSKQFTKLRYVFFVKVNWKEDTISIGLARKGNGSYVDQSWSAPINKDVMKTPGTFLHYLQLVVGQNDIIDTYLNR